ncbi:MAG TPA: hypothetical protein VLC98_16095 [Phnomibacter sp.]|nr:hypothetical protein [Phnomibacter sp.]
MKRNTFWIVLLIGLPLTFFAGWKCQNIASQFDEIGKPTLSVIKVSQDNNAKSLFFVSKRWGLTGDHQVVALTNDRPQDDTWRPNESKDYVWQGDVLIYYQKAGYHLRVWSNNLPDTTQKKIGDIEFVQLRGDLFNQLRKKSDEAVKVVD